MVAARERGREGGGAIVHMDESYACDGRETRRKAGAGARYALRNAMNEMTIDEACHWHGRRCGLGLADLKLTLPPDALQGNQAASQGLPYLDDPKRPSSFPRRPAQRSCTGV
jgi:hypothetical protein